MDITEITNILTKTELKRFGKFLKSPYFNTEQRFVKLFGIIKGKSKKNSREMIAKQFYGEKILLTDTRFRKLISEFMKLFQRFLSELEFEKDNFRRRLMLIEQLANRNLNKSYLQETKRAESSIETGGVKDEKYYARMLELYQIRYRKEGLNFNSWTNDFSFVINKYLDRYFVNLKLFLYQRYQTIEYSFHTPDKPEKTFIDSVMDYIKKHKNEIKGEHSDIYLLFMGYCMIEEPGNKVLFDEYLIHLSELENIPGINCKKYYEDLINYYTLLVNSGRMEFEINIIQVAQIMDERGYFQSGVNPNDYRIIIEAAIGLGKYDWAEEFAERNLAHINESNRLNIYASCMGKINFFSKNYIKAREFISTITYSDYTHYAEAKLIECRILYEEKLISELFANIETVYKYLNSHKEIGSDFKESYSSFLKYLKKLSELYEMNRSNREINSEINELEKIIEDRKSMFYGKGWLNEKINELKKAGY